MLLLARDGHLSLDGHGFRFVDFSESVERDLFLADEFKDKMIRHERCLLLDKDSTFNYVSCREANPVIFQRDENLTMGEHHVLFTSHLPYLRWRAVSCRLSVDFIKTLSEGFGLYHGIS